MSEERALSCKQKKTLVFNQRKHTPSRKPLATPPASGMTRSMATKMIETITKRWNGTLELEAFASRGVPSWEGCSLMASFERCQARCDSREAG